MLDLASGGRTAEPPEGVNKTEAENPEAPPTTTDDPVAAPAIPASDAEMPPATASKTVAGDLVSPTADSVAGGDENSFRAPEQAPPDESADPPKRRPVKRQTRASGSNARNVARAAGVEYGRGDPDVEMRPMTLSDEVAALDEDIGKLRRQLAAKLSLQNAQLKKMLERF